jgi:hypothetical protein
MNAKNCSPARLTLQITGLTAEHRLFAWQSLQITGVTAENAYLPDKLLQSFRSFVKFVRQVSVFCSYSGYL